MTTWYHCPLCGGSKIHSEPDAPYMTRGDNCGLVYETPLGRAMRIEKVLTSHMEKIHHLTADEAVEKLRAAQSQESRPE